MLSLNSAPSDYTMPNDVSARIVNDDDDYRLDLQSD